MPAQVIAHLRYVFFTPYIKYVVYSNEISVGMEEREKKHKRYSVPKEIFKEDMYCFLGNISCKFTQTHIFDTNVNTLAASVNFVG